MNVGSPAGDGMQRPAPKRALHDDRILDSMPLMIRQHDRVLGHEATCLVGKSGDRLACQAAIIDPAASVAGEPRAVGRPCEEDRQRFGNERWIWSVRHDGLMYTCVQFCARAGERSRRFIKAPGVSRGIVNGTPSPIKAPGVSRGMLSGRGEIPSLTLRAFIGRGRDRPGRRPDCSRGP